MVDAPSTSLGPPTVGSPDGGGPPVAGPKDQAGRALRWIAAILLGVTVAATGALTLGRSGAAAPAPAAGAHPVHLERSPHTVAPPLPTTTTTTTTGPTTIAPVTTPDTEPPVTTLIAEVEAAGVDPGPNWSWSMGDTSTECGAITDGGGATGCTSWASGAEKTVFSGSPSLALVAHELANAEAENDAVPSLLSQVAAAEGGTSWSATDAVASCLVEHFLGFQDNAAGTWQCPGALANLVADEIHETVTTTNTTATCGTTSGITSTLTFTGSAGTLTVTAPAPGSAPEVVAAGTPVTVSGIGSFTAVDQGGTISETGACAG